MGEPTPSPSEAGQAEGPATWFAPAERAPPERVEEQARDVAANPVVQALLDAADGYLLVLNVQRQVLAANRRTLESLDRPDLGGLVGMRPGEVLGCVHAQEGPGGCGTSPFCSTCGAVRAVLECQESGAPAESECLLTLRRDQHTESAEFRVRATPYQAGDVRLTVVVLSDISGEKRREALERIFFHDVMNTIGGLLGWSRRLHAGGGANAQQAAERLVQLSEELAREVTDQRTLLEAEAGSLPVRRETHPVASLLGRLEVIFDSHPARQDRELAVAAPEPGACLVTDEVLLLRVLTNMVKNALEAVPPGGRVRVCYEHREGLHRFQVWNPGVIPDPVGLRVFQRSFSTKGEPGRGIGTWAMKLFGERYLGGRVWFESDAGAGTRFFIELP